MTFPRDIGSYLYSIGKSYPGNLPKGRVRLLGCHGLDLQTDPDFLRALGDGHPALDGVETPTKSGGLDLSGKTLATFFD